MTNKTPEPDSILVLEIRVDAKLTQRNQELSEAYRKLVKETSDLHSRAIEMFDFNQIEAAEYLASALSSALRPSRKVKPLTKDDYSIVAELVSQKMRERRLRKPKNVT